MYFVEDSTKVAMAAKLFWSLKWKLLPDEKVKRGFV